MRGPMGQILAGTVLAPRRRIAHVPLGIGKRKTVGGRHGTSQIYHAAPQGSTNAAYPACGPERDSPVSAALAAKVGTAPVNGY